jgi:enterochelin esterase-like enzyme
MRALLRSAALILLSVAPLSSRASGQAPVTPTHTPPRRVTMPTQPAEEPALQTAQESHQQPPTVHPDGSITFSFPAPAAKSVVLSLEGFDPLPMKSGPGGSWSVTTPPLAPEVYGYSFKVNGITFLDPGNVSIKPNLLNLSNTIEVPGPSPRDWDVQDVPHGVLHHHLYRSQTRAAQSDFYVYTPPNYDPKTHYPVLYLLHGYSDDASGWTAIGRADIILDNLIAQAKVKPMIVIMPLGYGTMELITRHWNAWEDRPLVERNFTLFTQMLLNEIKPQAERLYSISADRKDHAIAGLSMGGGESLLTGLNHLDDFAYVGAFSSAVQKMNFDQAFPGLAADAQKPDRLKLLWVACGSDDDLIEPNRAFAGWLKQQQVPVTFVETPGRHTWMVWRDNLIQFTPLLFRN